MLSVLVGIASLRQFQRVPTTYDTEKRKGNNLEINAYQESCQLSLPLYNMSSCRSILKYLSLNVYGKLCLLT